MHGVSRQEKQVQNIPIPVHRCHQIQSRMNGSPTRKWSQKRMLIWRWRPLLWQSLAGRGLRHSLPGSRTIPGVCDNPPEENSPPPGGAWQMPLLFSLAAPPHRGAFPSNLSVSATGLPDGLQVPCPAGAAETRSSGFLPCQRRTADTRPNWTPPLPYLA